MPICQQVCGRPLSSGPLVRGSRGYQQTRTMLALSHAPVPPPDQSLLASLLRL